jgi:hypothetical protein
MREAAVTAIRHLWVVAALGMGCASAPAVPPGILDVTGTWDGTWNAGIVGAGAIGLTLEQRGAVVTGRLEMSGLQAISATDGPLEGKVSGNVFSFKQATGVIEGATTVNGDEMVGGATGRFRADLRLRRQR